MDIIQVLIFIVIIVAAIVQQISKTGKEKKTPSPKKVLADMFPEIEQEKHGRKGVLFLPAPAVRKPQSSPYAEPVNNQKSGQLHLWQENKRENRTPIKLSTKEEARRAFIYSEIFNRKY